jgi:hypothetical protein
MVGVCAFMSTDNVSSHDVRILESEITTGSSAVKKYARVACREPHAVDRR